MQKTLIAILFSLMLSMLLCGGAAAQSRASVSGSEVNGTFRMNFTGKFKDSASEIEILALGGGKLHFRMNLLYPYLMGNGEPMVNMGELEEDAAIKGDTAVYTSDDSKCTLTIKFTKPGLISVNQDGTDSDCGFGHNVSASGKYRKVSSKKPKFETM